MKHTTLITVVITLALLVIPAMGVQNYQTTSAVGITAGDTGITCQELIGYVTIGNPADPVGVEPLYQPSSSGCYSGVVNIPTITNTSPKTVLPDPFRSNPADRALDDYIRSVFVI
jgi:hypothetical protein